MMENKIKISLPIIKRKNRRDLREAKCPEEAASQEAWVEAEVNKLSIIKREVGHSGDKYSEKIEAYEIILV